MKKLNDFNFKYKQEFFNVCIRFSHITSKKVYGMIKPRKINKSGDASSSDSYRKVLISTCIFRFLSYFKYWLLPTISIYLNFSPCQFGYRRNKSTSLATFLFKETVGRCLSKSLSVFECLLDMRKAFERITHDLLVDKMNKKRLRSFLISIFS